MVCHRGGRNADLVFALAVAFWWADTLTWDNDGIWGKPIEYPKQTGLV